MLFPIQPLALGAIALSLPFTRALSASDIPSDTPVSQLITTATVELAKGNGQDALTYFDVAVARDPQNYLTIFRRGAAYLQLGKHSQAGHDFDKVLAIKPTFEGALVQRAKLKSRTGNWEAAKADYKTAGKVGGEVMQSLEEAQGAEKLSAEAEKAGDWTACTTNADIAIQVANGHLDLRQRRAKCRFEKGEIVEGVSDLLHVAQMSASSDLHSMISRTYFYALNETDSGLTQVRRCMHSDPDSKACSKLLKREKQQDKERKKIQLLMSKRQYNSAVKLLIPSDDSPGLLKEIEDETNSLKQNNQIPSKAPSRLHEGLVEWTCECYIEMNNHKKALPYCNQALSFDPNCLPALIGKATREVESDEFEEALRTLNTAKDAHGATNRINELMQKAQTLLKRSKQKDYYKVIGVSRDADEREIKRAYRKLSVKFHPDKAAQQGLTVEDAQKKMATINEAYEVLSDPELKARFDRGDDPNDQSQQQGNPFQGNPFGGGQPVFFQQGGGGGGQRQHFKMPNGGGFPGGGSFQGFPGGFPF